MKKRLEGAALKLDQSFDCERLFSLPLAEQESVQFHAEESLPPLGIRKGDIIVAGRNFGSMGEEFPEALKYAGVACIIAASFSRSFYRNCINLGLPLVENAEAFDKITDGETIAIDFDSREIASKKGVMTFAPYPEIIARILASGGLVAHVKRSLGK